MALIHIGIGTGRMLAEGVLKGRWTLEDLDTPSPGWAPIEAARVRSFTPGPPGSGRPTMPLPDAGQRRPYRNLACEWIAANPRQWEELMQQYLNAEQQPRRIPEVVRAEELPSTLSTIAP